MRNKNYILAFDSANEVISVGLGRLTESYSDANAANDAVSAATEKTTNLTIEIISTIEVEAHRASNTRLIPEIDALLAGADISRSEIACVAAGRGPGSFTGVRICLATAKGIASALGVGLIGVSTLDAVAWGCFACGTRGHLLVCADAMRREVYPALYCIDEAGVARTSPDHVVKATIAAEEIGALTSQYSDLQVCGDGLHKYMSEFSDAASGAKVIKDEKLWSASGHGLLLALQNMWQQGEIDPLHTDAHNPGLVLPVYTRLSDAEETERARLADTSAKNLNAGVQDLSAHGFAAQTTFEPLDAEDCDTLAEIEAQLMCSEAWNATQFADELGLLNRSWWVAKNSDEEIVGYAGGLVVGDTLEILKVAVLPKAQRGGIARRLLSAVANDARDLGATHTYLEVRACNKNAQMFYSAVGLAEERCREKYYSDGEDAVIMTGPLPIINHDVGGMHLRDGENSNAQQSHFADDKNSAIGDASNKSAALELQHPVIFAIESSCDETAAAISCNGEIIADVVASQIDFHKRFGGVVPEIASRKHIEAICGVAEECFEQASAAARAGITSNDCADKIVTDQVDNSCNPTERISWSDIDAVAVTYAPGLVGALVVGMAFAKGAAWAADKPLIGVNHLEGHLYANKLCDKLSGNLSSRDMSSGNLSHQVRSTVFKNRRSTRRDKLPDSLSHIQMPAVASIISGGNTLLVQVNEWGDYKTLGSTIDDAVGEAFDKVAKALRLGYPGGPVISKLAASGNPHAIDFPRAMMRSGDLNFSLSGLKTAVITHIEKNPDENINDLCASFQAAVIEVQVEKARTALRKCNARTFMFGGGVAANPALRAAYEAMCREEDVALVMPPLTATGDNAAMIALVANDRFKQGKFLEWDADVAAHAPLEENY